MTRSYSKFNIHSAKHVFATIGAAIGIELQIWQITTMKLEFAIDTGGLRLPIGDGLIVDDAICAILNALRHL